MSAAKNIQWYSFFIEIPKFGAPQVFIITYNFRSTKPTHVVLLANFSCQRLDKLLSSHKIKFERILAKRDRHYLSYVSFIIIYIRRICIVSSISRYLLIFYKNNAPAEWRILSKNIKFYNWVYKITIKSIHSYAACSSPL